ncbi:hypothetical protein J437_LFUL016525 [Ladona fulva]|uniref:Cuticle protein 6 n=1 Tax=Ladona fulva TaxID=123851 RepID=A0A8K0KJZ6_LADFU|nr:hypothetical protein J437_LFUL016525 [Ladona fulva]
MRSLLIVLSVLGVALAKPGLLSWGIPSRSLLSTPWAYSVQAPWAYPTISNQYHSQDALGQYSYGYSGGPSAKSEVKTFDGVTRGGYSYVDAEGKIQSVNYVADPVNGFRVAATNLPVAPAPIPSAPLVGPAPVQDTPEVAAAKQAHFAAVVEAKALAEASPEMPVAVNQWNTITPNVLPVVSPAVGIIPGSRFAYSTASPVLSAPISWTNSWIGGSNQYHAQDGLGQYSYGYSGGPSTKSEMKTFDGVTRGGYSYVDAEGKIQSVNYIADGLGFRVAATNLPVGPVAPETPILQTIPDTPEVAVAKAQHFAAVEEAKARAWQ